MNKTYLNINIYKHIRIYIGGGGRCQPRPLTQTHVVPKKD